MTNRSLKWAISLATVNLATGAFGQCFLNVHHQTWTVDNMRPFLQMRDMKTNTLRITTIEVALGFENEEPNLWIINKKRDALNGLMAANPGLTIWWLGRFDRTRGKDWLTVPALSEHDWWTDWTVQKSQNVDMVAVWNEPSLGWTPDKDPTRPERHAALVVKTLDKLGPNSRVLAPSVHGVSDLPGIGMGYTYVKRFFDALPADYRSRVLPDAHMYYGFGDGAFVDQKADLTAYTALMANYGYQPADLWFSEVGSEYKQPSSYSAGQTLLKIYNGLRSFGIPAPHIGIWQWESGVMTGFNPDGSLTDYGKVCQQLLQSP